MATVLGQEIGRKACSGNNGYVGAVTSATTPISAPAVVRGISLLNNTAAVAFLQMFDAKSVTLGTTVPNFILALSASQAVTYSPLDFGFNTGITLAGTTTMTGNTTASISVDMWGDGI